MFIVIGGMLWYRHLLYVQVCAFPYQIYSTKKINQQVAAFFAHFVGKLLHGMLKIRVVVVVIVLMMYNGLMCVG
jgi:hypothetical protein